MSGENNNCFFKMPNTSHRCLSLYPCEWSLNFIAFSEKQNKNVDFKIKPLASLSCFRCRHITSTTKKIFFRILLWNSATMYIAFPLLTLCLLMCVFWCVMLGNLVKMNRNDKYLQFSVWHSESEIIIHPDGWFCPVLKSGSS